ncbi:MAG TPA: adenosylhomocysteinase [Nitrososphaeraceae archaeon]|nr:adenosylhomocysteinase [Nitrososphaeraceae archaeon]
MKSIVAEAGSAKRGELSFLWARDHMGILKKIVEKTMNQQPLAGKKLSFCLHITKETSVLIGAAMELGAEIAACPANPLSTQDDLAAFLSEKGVLIYAWRGQNDNEYNECLNKVLQFNPQIIIDDGAELHVKANNLGCQSITGGTEETTTGVARLRALQREKTLLYPVIGVNDASTKYLFDNRYGTGQSTLDGLMRATGILIAGKSIVVCGYGWVGKGVAARARGMGAIVTVTEIDPIRALEAHMDGYIVKRLLDAAGSGDIFLTCTGQTKVIRKEHFQKMKHGAILANAGHFDVEIDVDYLYNQDSNPGCVRADVSSFNIVDKKIYLIGRGRVINLVSGEGHPPEVMSLSFANQLLSILFITKFHARLKNRLHKVPRGIDRAVAHYSIESMKIRIDKLTDEQKAYKNSV